MGELIFLLDVTFHTHYTKKDWLLNGNTNRTNLVQFYGHGKVISVITYRSIHDIIFDYTFAFLNFVHFEFYGVHEYGGGGFFYNSPHSSVS